MRQQVAGLDLLDTEGKIKKIVELLFRKQAIKSFHIVPSPPDEPLAYLYSCNIYAKNSAQQISGTGVSAVSKELALLKCLAEAVERYSLCINHDTKIKYLLPRKESVWWRMVEKTTKETYYGWVKGYNISQNKTELIPAQLIYLDYKIQKNEKLMTQPLSTGAAFGTTHESTLLRGIYEIVERDAFLTVFLNQITAPSINLTSDKSKDISSLIEKIEQYNLEVKLFDITNDLNIPTFVCILIDKTGLGPSCSFGLKASLDAYEAIAGAIEEAMHIRLWVRGRMVKNNFQSAPNNVKKVRTQEDRMIYWAPTSQLKKLDFLLKQDTINKHYASYKGSKLDELQMTLKILYDRGHDVYYADTTPPEVKQIGGFTYKIVIPSLQFFYMDENFKTINATRINEVAKFFNKENKIQNSIPHPFL